MASPIVLPTPHMDTLVVGFEGLADPYDPLNWPRKRKMRTSILYCATSMASVWASTAYAPATSNIAHRFEVATEIALLGTSLLLLGWGFGPLIWAPMSEVYGPPNISTLLVTRFLTGFFGAAPITCAGGAFVDMWNASERGNIFVLYTICVCGIPALAPVIGGVIVLFEVNWRWVEYVLAEITAILQSTIIVIGLFFIDETYAPTLLEFKASRLRKETGIKYHVGAVTKVTAAALAIKFGLRPLQILATPICLLVTIYSSFIYGIFYASLAAFPILFQDTRGWNPLTGALPFLSMMLGIFLGAGFSAWSQKYYIRSCRLNDFNAVPEARLPPMMFSSTILASGLFVIGWTSSRSTPWIATISGVFMLGFGYYVIFTSALNYLVDSFQCWSASALAANTFARSVFAAGLPLAIPYMFARLGNEWSFTVFAVFAVINIPIPFMFYIYGSRVRAKGRFTNN
ncbi:MFS multidrug transporter, putative [Cordyceps militaris CM01]|uniref:MFS multidrug transporter, putative n=1 Tax=Cordyceps militaris (strain CM01) TaxID=983644 RepID=G3JLD0_CORMM|nr:MFS multidrug transporter, putative [Cordyceps militaris CM01]EGX90504.1 MFS multidrug transporter, putative [Cordyceps militaris CM01]